MQIFITIIFVLTFAGCNSPNEKLRVAQERVIQLVIDDDWHTGLPLSALVDASELCNHDTTLTGCDIVKKQLLDVATAFASCKRDQKSNLCRGLVKTIKAHPISKLLPTTGYPMTLPQNPWYWNLSTRTLNDLSYQFKYRTEAFEWWWQPRKDELIPIFMLLLLVMAFGGWRLVSVKRKKVVAAAFQYAQKINKEMERKQEVFEMQNREKIKREVQRAREAEIIEQQRIVAKNNDELQATIADATQKKELMKKSEEQAETSRMLDAVFTSSGSASKKKHQLKLLDSTTDKPNS